MVDEMPAPAMSPSSSRCESRETPSIGKPSRTINKACIPCRARKVKCDAATTGLPCSSCQGRQCTDECLFLERKGRTTRKRHYDVASPIPTTKSPTASRSRRLGYGSKVLSRAGHTDDQTSDQAEPDLLYLRILNDAVDETVETRQPDAGSDAGAKLVKSLTPRNCLSVGLAHWDSTDREYLIKKSVFNLPTSQHLDALVKIYFDHVHTFSPVIDRHEFMRSYHSGNCSLLLLYAMLATASVHVPAALLTDCGFADRSAAQVSFFSRTKLLHDFAAEEDSLSLLQASITLCSVILDHPTDYDFGYWFHNAIRLATKLNLRKMCFRQHQSSKVLNMYRRIWWALYALDSFHVSLDTRRSFLLEDMPTIEPEMEDDWDNDDANGPSENLPSVAPPQRKRSLMAHCKLSRIFRQCLSILKVRPQKDPRPVMRLLDDWRKLLASQIQKERMSELNTYYLTVQALSYRLELVLCRQVQRQTDNTDWVEFAKQRLRFAMLELDTILLRVLAMGTIYEFPIFFITTINALLALHIQSAVDPSESELVRSMARISINQAMLLLDQGKDIPAIRRAIPIFNQVIARRNLSLVPSSSRGQAPALPLSQDNAVGVPTPPPTQVFEELHPLEHWENDLLLAMGMPGFDPLEEWQPF